MKTPMLLKLKTLSKDLGTSRSEFLMQHYKPVKILDLGNLGGVYEGGVSNSFNQEFRKKVEKDSCVYGFDLFFPQNPTEYPYQKKGNIDKGLLYTDKFFGTIYMEQLIEYLENPGKALREVCRVLKDDGVFILDTPNAYNFKRYARFVVKQEVRLGDLTHLIMFTQGSIRALLMRCGFVVFYFTMKYSKWWRWLRRHLVFIRGLGSTSILVARKKLS